MVDQIEDDEIGVILEGDWCRGDRLKVAVRPPVSLKALEAPNEAVAYREHIYERTGRDRCGYVVFEHRP